MNEDEVLGALGMNQSPFFTGGEPHLDAGLGSALASQPLLAMLVSQMTNTVFKQANMAPGQFFPHQNLLSQMESRAFVEDKQRAIASSAMMDRTFQVETLNNLSRSMFGSSMPAWMQSGVSQALDFMNPMLAVMAPGLMDSLSGPAGSKAVMANNLYSTAWFRPDAVTGQVGWSAASAQAMMQGLGEEMFGQKTYDPIAMSGMRAGQAGALALDLARRGMLSESIGTMGAAQQLEMLPEALQRQVIGRMGRGDMSTAQVLSKAESLTPEIASVLDSMRADGDPALQTAMRGVDKDRLKARLQEYSGALAAIRDVFGDAGMPNAPVGQLMQAMNSFTQGGMMGLGAGQVEKSIRTSWALAEKAGIGLPGLTGMMAQGHALAAQMGVPMAFVDQVVQGGIAYGGGFGDAGLGRSSQFADYGRGLDWHVGLRERREMGAVRAQTTQGLGALAHAQEMLSRSGGALSGEAASILEAALSGKEVDLSSLATQSGVAGLLRSGGVDSALASELARSRQDEYVHRNKFANYVANTSQPKEWERFVGSAMSGVVGDAFGKGRAHELGLGLAQEMRGLTSDQLADRATMLKTLGKWFSDQTNALPADAQNMVERMIMAGDRAIERDPNWAVYEGVIPGARQFNTGASQSGTKRQQEAEARTRMESAVAGLGQVGPLARIANMANDGDVTTFMEGVARALGGTAPADIDKALSGVDLDSMPEGSKEALLGMMGRFRELQGRFSSAAGDPAALDALERETRALIQGGDQANALAQSIVAKHAGGDPNRTVDQVLADPNVPEADKRTLRFAVDSHKRGGIRGAARAADVQVGGKLSGETPKEAAVAGSRLASSANLSDKEKSDLAMRLVGGVDSTILSLKSDPDSLKALGAGGVEAYAELQNERDRIERLAAKAGQSVEEYLAKNPADANVLSKKTDAVAAMANADPLTYKAMSEEETKRADTILELNKKSSIERSEEMARALTEKYGGKLTEEEIKGLGKQIEGLGERGQSALRAQMSARDKLDKEIGKLGYGANAHNQLASSAKTGDKAVFGADDERFKGMAADAGSLNDLRAAGAGGLGLSADAYRRAIESAAAKPGGDQGGGGGTGTVGKMALSGTVKIIGDELHVNGAMASTSPADAQGIA